MAVESNLKQLLDLKGISVRKCSIDISYRYESVRKLYNNDMEHFPKVLIDKLCDYLEVQPGDIIIRKKEQSE